MGCIPVWISSTDPPEAAKIIFDYEIHDTADDSLIATGHSTQVFLDKEYNLMWTNPNFMNFGKRNGTWNDSQDFR